MYALVKCIVRVYIRKFTLCTSYFLLNFPHAITTFVSQNLVFTVTYNRDLHFAIIFYFLLWAFLFITLQKKSLKSYVET